MVVGAGVAGLAAARVLHDRYDQVTVLDRDTLPDEAVPRRGVPQGSQPHILLASGLRELSMLFPGFEEELIAAGELPDPILGELLDRAEPLSEIVVAKFPSSRRRLFESLDTPPPGHVALGDAICSVNPIYGQGMTCATLSARALRVPDRRRHQPRLRPGAAAARPAVGAHAAGICVARAAAVLPP